MDSILYLIKHNSLSQVPDLEISVIISISNPLLITGSIKIEFIMNIKAILEELNSILSLLYIMPVCSTLPDSMPSLPLVEWMDGPDMIETLIWKSIFLNFHLLKSSKSFGMELQSLLEDWLNNKLSKNINIQLKPF